jgi:hypothetical protein
LTPVAVLLSRRAPTASEVPLRATLAPNQLLPPRVGRFDVRRLRPDAALAGENIRRPAARGRCGVVALIAVDARRGAIFLQGAHHDCIAREGERVAEQVLRARVRRFQIGLLRPRRARPGEDVHGAAVFGALVGLIAVDARRPAVFGRGPDRQRVAREGDAAPERIVVTDIRGLEIRDVGAHHGHPIDAGSARRVGDAHRQGRHPLSPHGQRLGSRSRGHGQTVDLHRIAGPSRRRRQREPPLGLRRERQDILRNIGRKGRAERASRGHERRKRWPAGRGRERRTR